MPFVGASLAQEVTERVLVDTGPVLPMRGPPMRNTLPRNSHSSNIEVVTQEIWVG